MFWGVLTGVFGVDFANSLVLWIATNWFWSRTNLNSRWKQNRRLQVDSKLNDLDSCVRPISLGSSSRSNSHDWQADGRALRLQERTLLRVYDCNGLSIRASTDLSNRDSGLARWRSPPSRSESYRSFCLQNKLEYPTIVLLVPLF